MKPPLLLTVLMAVHNGGADLQSALDSILTQSFGEFEFLIIDDASTDSTPAVLAAAAQRDSRIRLVRQEENRGLTASLNAGLALARGTFIARQDADDLSHPTRLEAQLEFLHSMPSVAAAGTQVSLIDGQGASLGKKDYPCTHRAIEWMNLFDNALAHSSVMFRKAPVLEVGAYDESFPASQDYDLWTRLGERFALANLPRRLVTLRILAHSITRTHRRPGLIRDIQRAHWSRLFPGTAPSEDDLDLIGLFRSRIPRERLVEFHGLFNERLTAFRAAWPESRISADFARTLALQFERIGYNLLPAHRAAAMREFLLVLSAYPPAFFTLPWARILALALLGDSARSLYEKLTCKK